MVPRNKAFILLWWRKTQWAEAEGCCTSNCYKEISNCMRLYIIYYDLHCHFILRIIQFFTGLLTYTWKLESSTKKIMYNGHPTYKWKHSRRFITKNAYKIRLLLQLNNICGCRQRQKNVIHIGWHGYCYWQLGLAQSFLAGNAKGHHGEWYVGTTK